VLQGANLFGDLLLTFLLDEHTQGANINNLRNEHVDDLQIPYPESDAQEQFIKFLRQSDKSKFALQQALKEARALQKKIVEDNFIIQGKEIE
jgi:type I restriction enzyme S subunit